MDKKFTSTIAGASILITGVGLISRGFGFIREVVYASNFGLQTSFDVYLIGAVIPVTLNTSVIFLAQNYFIPAYHKKLSESKLNATLFFRDNFWFFIFASVIVTLLLFLFSAQIVARYIQEYNSEPYNLALNIFRIFLLTIPFNAGYAVLASYCHAGFDFKKPAVSSLFQNIIIIVLVVLLSGRIGIYTIPLGYVAGIILQFFYLYGKIRKEGINLLSEVKFKIKTSLFFNRILIMTVIVEIIGQLFILADRFFFNKVEPGGIAALNYAIVLYTLPISIFSAALSTAIFPKISESINKKNYSLLQTHFSAGIKINMFLFIPITLLLIFYGDTIIRILYQRGEFGYRDTIMTSAILKIYIISLIFYATYAVVNKIIYGAGLIKYLLFISIGIVLLKVLLNIILVDDFKQDGLAASTSICYILLSISSYFLIVKKLNLKNSVEFFTGLIFYLSIGFLSFIIVLVTEPIVRLSFYLKPFISLSVFIIVYCLSIILLKPKEYFIIRETFLKAVKE